LKDLFHASVERNAPRLVISGPASVGKSRLGWSADKHVPWASVQIRR
jgi:hypothetical protein